MIRLVTPVGLLSVAFLMAAVRPSAAAEDGWVALFDGKSLDGWIQRGGEAKYKAVDGRIVGTAVPNTANSFLCTEKHYGDFLLEVEFLGDRTLNSGVQIRSSSLPDYRDGRVHGYQVEIDPSDRGWTGGIYDEGRRGWLNSLENNAKARYAVKQNEWNQFRILAVGDSIKTWLNGVPAADLVDSMTPTGFIALQVHGVGSRTDGPQVQWRNLRIKELDGSPPELLDEPVSETGHASDLPVVPEGATVEQLATGFIFTEGPAPAGDGNIYFSDVRGERTYVYNPAKGEASVAREKTGRANGLMVTPAGALIICEGGNRQLTRLAADELTVLADSFDGKRLNSPNDLDLDGKGGIYFTDPRYGDRTDMEMDVEGVYYVPRKGKMLRVIDDLERPNGLILSLDNKTLYVADNGAKTIMAYDVEPNGSLSAGRKLAEMDLEANGGGDGMTIDCRGNIYCAGQGHIWIWDPEGTLVGKIPVPEGPANCVFGGPDGKTLFITARTSLYSIGLNVCGG